MNPAEIRELLKDCVDSPEDIEFVGFPQPDRGWYIDGTGPETRAHSERRAAKFYLWLCEYLDEQLSVSDASDLFDAGVQVEGEEAECEHDKFAQRIRRRRTALFLGHGDFMSLVIKRIIAGYGHYVETEGIPHRKYTFCTVLLCYIVVCDESSLAFGSPCRWTHDTHFSFLIQDLRLSTLILVFRNLNTLVGDDSWSWVPIKHLTLHRRSTRNIGVVAV
jgi:hypothetical protein